MSPSRPPTNGPRRPPTTGARRPPNRASHRPNTVVGVPDPDDQRHPAFSYRYADHEYNGAWSWPQGAEYAEMTAFLCRISQYTWADLQQLRRKNGRPIHHSHEIADVCSEAQKRIGELGHDERFETLFRFGVDRRKRLWGYSTDGVFYILWWDRDHRVSNVL